MFIFESSKLLFGFGYDDKVLYASRMLGGINAALSMPAIMDYVADIKTTSKAMRYVAPVINTGFIIGPEIGEFLAEVKLRLPVFFAAELGFLGAIFSLFFLTETTPNLDERSEVATKQKLDLKRFWCQCILFQC
jgi:MFS family permease